eukprot:6227141-Lingulodinium_polyedra.AAC.1
MARPVVSIAESIEGSIVDSTRSPFGIVQGCPQRVPTGLYRWLYIESIMVCAIVSTPANTEEFPVFHSRH